MNAAGVNPATSAALIIDADNISDAAPIERALHHLKEMGLRLTVRRAYGGHEKLSGLKDCLLQHGIRGLVNQGKGTTDALLCVDVMDLFHAAELPDTVAIASSDGDFAPLVVRLREAGIRTICFAQEGKSAGDELVKVYDRVIYVDAGPAPAVKAAARPAKKAAAAKKAVKAKPVAPPDPLEDALFAIPGFDEGDWVEMNEVVRHLRDAKLLSKSASGPKFLAKNAPYVELAPNRVRLKSGRR